MSYETIAKCDTCGADIARAENITKAREAAKERGAVVWTRGTRIRHSCGPCEAKRVARIGRPTIFTEAR